MDNNSAAGTALLDKRSAPVDPRDRLIVALDLAAADAAMDLVDELQATCRWFKVGLELYCAAGNAIVEKIRGRGFQVFLDLKLHDIPSTVAAAVRSVRNAGASLLTVHACGGEAMLRAAAEAAQAPDAPRLLAVTVLTSMDAGQLSGVGVGDGNSTDSALPAQVVRLAKLAKAAGIDGVVCSAGEIQAVREAIGTAGLVVVPGIRPSGTDVADQRRVATPADAVGWGASMLVVGRPITRADEPAKAAAAILKQMEGL